MSAPILVIEGIALKGNARSGQPWAHMHHECGCEAHETFTCDRCGRRVGYCLGALDDMPQACTFCWAARNGGGLLR